MLRNLDRALNHPDMTPELAEVLSTPSGQLDYRVETNMSLDVTPSQRASERGRLALFLPRRGNPQRWQS